MAGTLTANEEAQLLQTIEMFEVITLSQPMDYQSLEILKEAYSKLGREQDVVNTSKRIAQAYVQLGQLSSAILEYESILQRFPDDPDVKQALAEIEDKANSFAAPVQAAEAEFVEKASASAALKKSTGAPTDLDDGKQQMQKLLVEAKLISGSDVDLYWPTPDLSEKLRNPAEPFLQAIADKQLVPLDKSLKVLCEKTRVAYLPIERYDVDVDLARTFPKDVCMRWAVLPFDRMSKSVCVATANPFNKQALHELEAHAKGRVIWYLSSPGELVRMIKKVYR
jgi:tetratricopeptide (TPR) repeat protein